MQTYTKPIEPWASVLLPATKKRPPSVRTAVVDCPVAVAGVRVAKLHHGSAYRVVLQPS